MAARGMAVAVLAAWVVTGACAAEPARSLLPALPAGKSWRLAWQDEFEGTALDRTKWDFRLHIMQTRHQTFTNAGARVENGLLHLDLIEKDGQYYSAHLQTGRNFLDRPGNPYSTGLVWPIAEIEPPLFAHTYGYYEIRCQLQRQPGWWSAFWLQSPTIGSSLDPAVSGVELDIMENFTRTNLISHNVHWDGYGKNHKHKGSGEVAFAETPDRFHTFGLHWTRTNYVFYVDGRESWRVEGPVSQTPQFLLVSTECEGYRKGNRDQPSARLKTAVLPDAFVVDHVRVYDEAE